MAGASILEWRPSSGSGDWPAGYGGGWWMLDASGVEVVQLPTGVASVASKDALVVRQEAGEAAWWLMTPAGVRTSYARGRAGNVLRMDFTLTGSTPVDVAASFRDSGGYPASFEVLSSDLATAYASYSEPASPGPGSWVMFRLSGPGGFTARWNSTNIRLYGLVFGVASRPGRLLCNEPGASGLLS